MALRRDEARRIVEAALDHARKCSAEITICVCDGDGRLVALERMDGAVSTSDRSAIGKAIASALTGRPSAQMPGSGEVAAHRATVSGLAMPLMHRQGGMPIYRDGFLLGACGAGGADAETTDEACATVGIGAVMGLTTS